MKVAVRTLFMLLMIAVLAPATFAQSTPDAVRDVPSPFAGGIGEVATYLDQRGTPVLELSVTGIEREWDGYDRWSEPQAGSDFVLVSMTVTNLGTRPFVVEPYDFSLVDSLGVSQSRSWVSGGSLIMSEDTTIDGGASIEFQLVFEVFSDLDPLMLFWSPEFDVYVVMYLGN